MRFLAFFTFLSLLTLLSSCQPSYGGAGDAAYRNYMARVAHTATPIPSGARKPSRIGHSSLIPARPLAIPSTPPPAPNCEAVCVIDPRTGNILYAHNYKSRRQVASTQKIVTALCICDSGNLNKMVTVERSDNLAPPIRLNLKPGTSYRKGDLLRAMLMGSFNDVAVTLARDTAGSVENFVRLMNARARRMRMYDTHFANPNGLPAAQYSTAYDMALAACYAYNNPVIREYINLRQYDFRRENGSVRTINTTNKLLHSHPWVHGMKTGYTHAAGRCLISCGSKNGRAVIVVVLGCSKSGIWAESLKYLKWALQIA